jgi:hypothetical protein
MSAAPVVIQSAVEGDADGAVIRRLVTHLGGVPGETYGRNGKDRIRRTIRGYNNAARFAPWVVLVDLNGDEACAPPLRNSWLPRPAASMCFRVAVREVEAWLLADADGIARFLGISPDRVTPRPEGLADPKQEMVNLARRSSVRDIREDMVPRRGSGAEIGPAYTSRLIEFIRDHWRPEEAAQRSESLRRAMSCIRHLIEGAATTGTPDISG